MYVSQLNIYILFNWRVLAKNNYSFYYGNNVFNYMFHAYIKQYNNLRIRFLFMRYWKLFFLQGSLKNFNLKKNSKFLNSQLFKSDNNFFKLRNVPLIVYQHVLIITYGPHIIDNSFINNIEKIFKSKIVL